MFFPWFWDINTSYRRNVNNSTNLFIRLTIRGKYSNKTPDSSQIPAVYSNLFLMFLYFIQWFTCWISSMWISWSCLVANNISGYSIWEICLLYPILSVNHLYKEMCAVLTVRSVYEYRFLSHLLLWQLWTQHELTLSFQLLLTNWGGLRDFTSESKGAHCAL